MSELRQLAQNRLADMAGRTLARLHVDAGGKQADSRAIQRIASSLWTATNSGQVCVLLDDLPLDDARQVLMRSPLVFAPGSGDLVEDIYPLVIQSDRLYPLRQWRAEHTIATRLIALASAKPLIPGSKNIGFTSGENSNDPQQTQALHCAQTRRLLVLSGGPGTGKTTTLGVIVRALTRENTQLRVALTAPTGKATARLNAAIGAPQGVSSAATLHRLLGYQTGGVFTFGPENPLPYDVIVVDECSMVDAMLGAHLLSALPSNAQLILAGDKDQLSSVEPGAFFGSVCAVKAAPLAHNIVILQKNYRQQGAPEIASWAGAIRSGELADAMPPKGEQVLCYSHKEADGLDALVQQAVAAYRPLVERAARTTKESEQLSLLEEYEQLRVLTSMRVGPFGVEAVNRRLVSAVLAALGIPETRWFAGRLVIVTNNAPSLNLFNGDIGLTTTDADGQLSVLFNVNGLAQRLLPLQMPVHEDALALTVHQSQGSDFARVLLLPAPAEHPLATRAGLYTGVTRAREQLHIYAPDADLQWAARHRTVHSGALTGRIESLIQMQTHQPEGL